MKNGKHKTLQVSDVRIFPSMLGALGSFLFSFISVSGGGSALLSGLSTLLFTAALFLVLITAFNEINKRKRKSRKRGKHKEVPPETPASEPEAVLAAPSESLDGLMEMRKDDAPQRERPADRPNGLSIAYILSFILLLCLRIVKIPMRYDEFFDHTIVHAVLLLAYACAALIYLKMRRDDGAHPGDRTSRDMLTLLSFTMLVFAAVIAANAVLKVNILPALMWVYYAMSAWLLAALAANLLLSVFKREVLGDFNYTLLPKLSLKAKDKKGGFLESEEARQRFSLKSLWTIQYTLRILPGLALGLGAVLLLSTAAYVVQPHQQAAVYRFGKLRGQAGTGLHLKLPWPVDKADIYDVGRARSMLIGYEASDTTNFLWTQAHEGGEHNLLLGNGNETVSVNMKVAYKISDLTAYVKTCAKPEEVLSAAAYQALMRRTVNTTLDAFLSEDRTSLSASLSQELSDFCASEGLGLTVVQAIVENIHPPVEVADVYQAVVTASVDKNTIITNAQAQAQQQRIGAERESKTAVDNARAAQFRRVSEARKEMAVYYAALEAYRVSPASFRLAKYLHTFETVLGGSKVYVFSPGTEGDMQKFVLGGQGQTQYIPGVE